MNSFPTPTCYPGLSIGGNLDIERFLTDKPSAAFQNLRVVGGDLVIDYNDLLDSIVPLNMLTRIGKGLYIYDMARLKDICIGRKS
jgi:hypothetical protein